MSKVNGLTEWNRPKHRVSRVLIATKAVDPARAKQLRSCRQGEEERALQGEAGDPGTRGGGGCGVWGCGRERGPPQ